MKLKSGFICLLGVLAPLPLFAAPIDVEVGGEYHFNLVNSDDGLNPEGSRIKETDFAVKAAKLALRGKLTDQITWNVLYQLDSAKLERYWVTNKVSDSFDISIGQQKIKTYGWHRRLTGSATTPVRAAYLAYNPLGDALAVDFAYKLAGQGLSLSLVKDYFDSKTACTATGVGCDSWNQRDVQKQPATVVEWIGAFGELQPLVQYTTYDRGHSSVLSAGLRFKSDVLDTYLDYTLDTRNRKGVDAVTGKSEDNKNKITGVVLYGEYKAGLVSPYLHVSTLNFDEYTAPGAVEIKTNGAGKLDDNEQTVALGVFFENWGSLYRPYVGIARYSGKYVDPNDANKEENRNKLDLMAGLTGKF